MDYKADTNNKALSSSQANEAASISAIPVNHWFKIRLSTRKLIKFRIIVGQIGY